MSGHLWLLGAMVGAMRMNDLEPVQTDTDGAALMVRACGPIRTDFKIVWVPTEQKVGGLNPPAAPRSKAPSAHGTGLCSRPWEPPGHGPKRARLIDVAAARGRPIADRPPSCPSARRAVERCRTAFARRPPVPPPSGGKPDPAVWRNSETRGRLTSRPRANA